SLTGKTRCLSASSPSQPACVAITPLSACSPPLVPCTTTRWLGSARGSRPPTARNRTNPSSSTWLTIMPISSTWAAYITRRGLIPSRRLAARRTAITLPMRSRQTSSACFASSAMAMACAGSSNPDTPGASDRRRRRSRSRSLWSRGGGGDVISHSWRRAARRPRGPVVARPSIGVGVDRVAQAVAEEVEGEHDEREREARVDGEVRVGAHRGDALRDHGPPARRGRRRADPDEAQERLGGDEGGDRERDVHEQRADEPRHDVAAYDP